MVNSFKVDLSRFTQCKAFRVYLLPYIYIRVMLEYHAGYGLLLWHFVPTYHYAGPPDSLVLWLWLCMCKTFV